MVIDQIFVSNMHVLLHAHILLVKLVEDIYKPLGLYLNYNVHADLTMNQQKFVPRKNIGMIQHRYVNEEIQMLKAETVTASVSYPDVAAIHELALAKTGNMSDIL